MSIADRPHPIAVIGAGFSGTMAAIQLLGTLPLGQKVLLCERAGAFGRGLAYATANPDHLLNLRVANMSAFPDRPADFETWIGSADFDARERSGTPSEMAKINANIDAEGAKTTFDPLAGIRERAAEMDASDAAREAADADERKKPRRTLKEKMGIEVVKRRGWRDEETKKGD